jgi:hypothetical protein
VKGLVDSGEAGKEFAVIWALSELHGAQYSNVGPRGRRVATPDDSARSQPGNNRFSTLDSIKAGTGMPLL